MVAFIYTVVIGTLNGIDAVTFERKALMAHLHVGTLAWITTAVFAGALILFGEAGKEDDKIRWLARAAPVVAEAPSRSSAHVTVRAGGTTEMRLRVSETGSYEYYCAVPGHRAAGMRGTLVVEP